MTITDRIKVIAGYEHLIGPDKFASFIHEESRVTSCGIRIKMTLDEYRKLFPRIDKIMHIALEGTPYETLTHIDYVDGCVELSCRRFPNPYTDKILYALCGTGSIVQGMLQKDPIGKLVRN